MCVVGKEVRKRNQNIRLNPLWRPLVFGLLKEDDDEKDEGAMAGESISMMCREFPLVTLHLLWPSQYSILIQPAPFQAK